MKETMERMEAERADMVAEVEAQIERALASMAVGIDDSDMDSSSRPQSRLSSISGQARSIPSRSRRTSDAGKRLRSFGTESTLAESYVEARDELIGVNDRGTETIEEADEEADPLPRKKRFSASEVDGPQDGMNAVDEGISQKTDKIAQKVLEIQQKVSNSADIFNIYIILTSAPSSSLRWLQISVQRYGRTKLSTKIARQS
jgi:nicotinamide N-methyltransferase